MIVSPLRDELHQIETKIKTLLPELDLAAEDYVNLVQLIPHHHRRTRTFPTNLTRPGRLD